MTSSEFRFLHAADLHLDAPFAALGRVAPEIAERLRDASLNAFDGLVATAIEREAAFVVFAGDLYDAADRGVRAQLRFLRGVERLGQRGIPVFVAHGNHDPLDGWSAMRRAPANLTIFGGESVEQHVISRDGEPLAHIYGISYPRRDVTENLALRFRRADGPGLHIAVLHANAGSQPDHPAYSPCSIADLTDAGMDYWALGHIHRHLVLRQGRPWIVYPGCVQGTKSNDLGPRGAALVTAAGAEIQGVEFIELDRVRFAHIEVDIGAEPDLHGLRNTILFGARAERDTLLTVTLAGRGSVHLDLRRPGAVEELLRDVREELGVASPFTWVDRITDRTGAEIDRETIQRRGDFSADLTRMVDRLGGDPEALAELSAGLALPYRLGSSDKASGAPADAESLLHDAEELALDLLESERRQ